MSRASLRNTPGNSSRRTSLGQNRMASIHANIAQYDIDFDVQYEQRSDEYYDRTNTINYPIKRVGIIIRRVQTILRRKIRRRRLSSRLGFRKIFRSIIFKYYRDSRPCTQRSNCVGTYVKKKQIIITKNYKFQRFSQVFASLNTTSNKIDERKKIDFKKKNTAGR